MRSRATCRLRTRDWSAAWWDYDGSTSTAAGHTCDRQFHVLTVDDAVTDWMKQIVKT